MFNLNSPIHLVLINKVLQPLKSPSLSFSLFVLFCKRHVSRLIKVQPLTWIYLKQITRTDRFLMLLSKLDQRCEAAFVHIRMEGWGGGGVRRTAPFVGWYLEKQRPVSLHTPACSPSLSPRRDLCPSFCLSPESVMDLQCVEYIICRCLLHIRPALIYQWHSCLCLCPLYR